jgi:hypothetical protein
VRLNAGEWKFPCPEGEIASYTAFRTPARITVDGRLDEAAWGKAPRSPRFIDIISGAKPALDTQAALLWDDENLYVAYWIEEPQLHAKFKNHNDPIYYDNDVELFIAGKDSYYEFEINGYNTCYEVFFIWEDAYEKNGFSKAPEFQKSKLNGFNGVGFTKHPRGMRLGNFQWTFPGKKTAVALNGTANDDSDRDQGWTVECAFPWKGMEWLAKGDGRSLPPKEGDVWRIDFSRFNVSKKNDKDSGGWVWSRHGIWDSHIPECFPKIQFSRKMAGEGN